MTTAASATTASTITAARWRPRREAFFLRILGPGDYRYEGADLGILVMRGRLMTPKFELTERARRWIDGIRAHYQGQPLAPAAAPMERSFKIL